MCFQLQVVESVLSLSSQLTSGRLEFGRKQVETDMTPHYGCAQLYCIAGILLGVV
jgi:hypothetical protein